MLIAIWYEARINLDTFKAGFGKLICTLLAPLEINSGKVRHWFWIFWIPTCFTNDPKIAMEGPEHKQDPPVINIIWFLKTKMHLNVNLIVMKRAIRSSKCTCMYCWNEWDDIMYEQLDLIFCHSVNRNRSWITF